MKKYVVESRKDYMECFDNYLGDYIIAGNEEEAIEHYKNWLMENGCTKEEADSYEYQVKEYWH